VSNPRRQAFARLLAQGWTDATRKLYPDRPLWTFWDYKFERWQKDKGMRLDHFLLSPNLSVRLVDGGVDRWARGQKTRATTRRHGSCLISRPESRFQRRFLGCRHPCRKRKDRAPSVEMAHAKIVKAGAPARKYPMRQQSVDC
jgi:hypothetical protein